MASLAVCCMCAVIVMWLLAPTAVANPVPMTTEATSPLRRPCQEAAVVVERAASLAQTQFLDQCLRWCSTYGRNASLCDTIRVFGEVQADEMNLGIDVTAANVSVRSVFDETLSAYFQRVTWSQGTLELMTSRHRKYVCDVYNNLGVTCPSASALCDAPAGGDVSDYCGLLAVLHRLESAESSVTALMTLREAEVPTADPGSDFEADTRVVQEVHDLIQLSRVHRLLATIATRLATIAAAV